MWDVSALEVTVGLSNVLAALVVVVGQSSDHGAMELMEPVETYTALVLEASVEVETPAAGTWKLLQTSLGNSFSDMIASVESVQHEARCRLDGNQWGLWQVSPNRTKVPDYSPRTTALSG